MQTAKNGQTFFLTISSLYLTILYVAETRLDKILLCKQTYSEATRCQVAVSSHCILFESTLCIFSSRWGTNMC